MHEFSPREPDNLSCTECSKGRYHQNHDHQYDSAGVDRQTYERPNCGSSKPHDQHFHSPIGGLTLNCPGKSGRKGMDEAKAREFLDKHGGLIMAVLDSNTWQQREGLETATANGWTAIAQAARKEIAECTEAMRELELLRGEG